MCRYACGPTFRWPRSNHCHVLAYADLTLAATDTTADMAGLSERDWADYEDTIAIPNDDPDRSFGGYAVAARKRPGAAARCGTGR